MYGYNRGLGIQISVKCAIRKIIAPKIVLVWRIKQKWRITRQTAVLRDRKNFINYRVAFRIVCNQFNFYRLILKRRNENRFCYRGLIGKPFHIQADLPKLLVSLRTGRGTSSTIKIRQHGVVYFFLCARIPDFQRNRMPRNVTIIARVPIGTNN